MFLSTLLLALTLQAPPQPATTSTEYVVGPQDRLSITVVDEPTLTKLVTVGADGAFDYPYIGLVRAAGSPFGRSSWTSPTG